MWCKIERIEDSIFEDSNSKLAYFNYLKREELIIVSDKVLKYLKIKSIEEVKEIFVLRTFSNDKPIFIIKKIRK